MNAPNTPVADESRALPEWQPPALEELQGQVPGCEILELAGAGGMGAVYKARQTKLDRIVAVKLLAVEISRNPEVAARFESEARLLAKFEHPNIVHVYDFGLTTGGSLYFVMEYVDGKDLFHYLHGTHSVKEVVKISLQVCDALAAAHSRGVVHRDIKPANLIINSEGKVKVADFGGARVMTAGGVNADAWGTPGYCAPEAAWPQADHRVDIFSLGALMYEALTGRVPHWPLTPPSVLNPQRDKQMDGVVMKALALDPAERWQTAAEFRAALEPFLVSQPGVPTARVQVSAPARKPAKSAPGPVVARPAPAEAETVVEAPPAKGRLGMVAAIAGTVVVLGGGGAALMFGGGKKEAADQSAQAEPGAAASVPAEPEPSGTKAAPSLITSFGPEETGSKPSTKGPKEPGPLGKKMQELAAAAAPEGGKRPPAEALEFSGHHYLIASVQLHWKEAKKFAEDCGGHLLTLTSKQEIAFITDSWSRLTGGDSIQPPEAWTGGINPGKSPDGWTWVTGEPWADPFWMSDEPDLKYPENPVYLRRDPTNLGMRDGAGNDLRCLAIEWEQATPPPAPVVAETKPVTEPAPAASPAMAASPTALPEPKPAVVPAAAPAVSPAFLAAATDLAGKYAAALKRAADAATAAGKPQDAAALMAEAALIAQDPTAPPFSLAALPAVVKPLRDKWTDALAKLKKSSEEKPATSATAPLAASTAPVPVVAPAPGTPAAPAAPGHHAAEYKLRTSGSPESAIAVQTKKGDLTRGEFKDGIWTFDTPAGSTCEFGGWTKPATFPCVVSAMVSSEKYFSWFVTFNSGQAFASWHEDKWSGRLSPRKDMDAAKVDDRPFHMGRKKEFRATIALLPGGVYAFADGKLCGSIKQKQITHLESFSALRFSGPTTVRDMVWFTPTDAEMEAIKKGDLPAIGSLPATVYGAAPVLVVLDNAVHPMVVREVPTAAYIEKKLAKEPDKWRSISFADDAWTFDPNDPATMRATPWTALPAGPVVVSAGLKSAKAAGFNIVTRVGTLWIQWQAKGWNAGVSDIPGAVMERGKWQGTQGEETPATIAILPGLIQCWAGSELVGTIKAAGIEDLREFGLHFVGTTTVKGARFFRPTAEEITKIQAGQLPR